MKSNTLLKNISLFIFLFFSIVVLKRLTVFYLAQNQTISYESYLLTKTIYNVILAVVSFYMIKINGLKELAGITKIKPKKIGLVIIGGLYLILLNIVFSDDIINATITNVSVLLIYCISIGLSEELSIRGFLQSSLVNYFKNPKKAIFIASLFFGIVHLIRFDKGVYGESSQVFYAAFIGVMFGVLLLITKRIYPLVIIHALIDFFAKIDRVGQNFNIENINTTLTSLPNAVLNILVVLPCLLYGLFLMKKYIVNNHN